MEIKKVERFLTPSGALFETEAEATNEMLNYASQIVGAAEPAALVKPTGELSEAMQLLGQHAAQEALGAGETATTGA